MDNKSLPPRPGPRTQSPATQRSESSVSQRSESSMSLNSDDSIPLTTFSVSKRPPHPLQQTSTIHPGTRPSTAGNATQPIRAVPSLQSLGRSGLRTSVDGSSRQPSPNMPSSTFGAQYGHRARQHSQGFFEPSLPNVTSQSPGLSASQIAAQAAMHHVTNQPAQPNQERKRSVQGLAQINTSQFPSRKPSDTQSPQVASAGPLGYSNGLLGSSRMAATTAANVVFPQQARSNIPPSPTYSGPYSAQSQPSTKEAKSKTSKMNFFSKPKTLNLTRDKDTKASSSGMQSPGRSVMSQAMRGNFANASTTSLVEPASSSASIYSLNTNASTSTLVPTAPAEKEKEKSRHNFLSRSKHKAKDEHVPLPLSSASSNSQAVNPERPQPLYSFTPDSPGGAASFAKTMSGFDLRHGGRALREKKKEERAAAAAAAKFEAATLYANQPYSDKSDAFSLYPSVESTFGVASSNSQSNFSTLGEQVPPTVSALAVSNIGSAMGVPGLGPDDIWPLLKARLLNLFSGESLVRPVEELNVLVSAHIERCVRRKIALVLVEDLRELLQTGFGSLAQTLRSTPEDRLITKLVDTWVNVYGAIVPFLQAVFLPLDLEFRGKGTYLTPAQAKEIWVAMPEAYKSDDRASSTNSTGGMKIGDELDVRRITLITFRDTVILPKHEVLMAIFSRLSLGSINAAAASPQLGHSRTHSRSDPAHPGAERPGTASSISPHMSSFNSQGSTLLDAASTSSGGAMSLDSRSRATSNTSAGSFGTAMPHLSATTSHPTSNPLSSLSPSLGQNSPPILKDPAKVTETVAKMLQCLYVLASCQTGDVGQGVVERLTSALKYNWLGRGRTGRDRRGWVGVKTGQQRIGLVGA